MTETHAPRPTAVVIRGDARALPLPDESVDLICTSPPYYGLRDYRDGDQSLAGQIGNEPHPREYIDNLIGCTREWMRVLKPEGSIWVNLGDSYYSGRGAPTGQDAKSPARRFGVRPLDRSGLGFPPKSLIGLPWRYAIACIDDLGLTLRAEVIWDKPNGLPESVTDRVRRSHEHWFHFTLQRRYYSAVDEIREQYAPETAARYALGYRRTGASAAGQTRNGTLRKDGGGPASTNPLGKLPGSVWEIATQPLKVPAHLGVDHFACVDTETEILTRRGWLRYDQVVVGDEVAGYDLDVGVTTWTQCHGVHRYDYDGDLVSVDGRGMSMRLTPNHRTIVQRRRVGRAALRGRVEVIDAAQLNRDHLIPRSVDWSDDGREKSIGADMASLCAWVAAEGWVTPEGRVYVCQSITANPGHVEAIDALLDRVPRPPADRSARVKFRESLNLLRRTVSVREWRGRESRVVTWGLPLGLSQELMGLLPGKVLPTWFADLPRDEAVAALNAFIDADGHRRRDGRCSIFQADRRNLDVLQVLAVKAGYTTSLRRDESNDRWVLYLTSGRPANLRRSDGTSLVGREHYKGIVWCVTTGTGTFVARRNGSVFVTGNSFPMEFPRRIIRGWSPRGGTVVDPFGGTGTTALVASVLGRHGISVDRSADYCRLAQWRTTDPGERARALGLPKPPPENPSQERLFEDIA